MSARVPCIQDEEASPKPRLLKGPLRDTGRRSYNTGKIDVNGRHSPGTNSGAIAMRQPLTVGFQFPSYDLSPIAIGELYLRAFRLTHQVIY